MLYKTDENYLIKTVIRTKFYASINDLTPSLTSAYSITFYGIDSVIF